MLKNIANITFAYSLVVAIFAVYQRTRVYFKGGECPVNSQRLWLYSAIFAIGISILLSYLDDKQKKKQ